MQSAYEIIAAMLKSCFDDLTREEYCLLSGRCDAYIDMKREQQAKTEALLQKHSNIEIIKCNGKSE